MLRDFDLDAPPVTVSCDKTKQIRVTVYKSLLKKKKLHTELMESYYSLDSASLPAITLTTCFRWSISVNSSGKAGLVLPDNTEGYDVRIVYLQVPCMRTCLSFTYILTYCISSRATYIEYAGAR